MYKYKGYDIDETATPELQELHKLMLDKNEKISNGKEKILAVLKTFSVDKASLLKLEDYNNFKAKLKKLK